MAQVKEESKTTLENIRYGGCCTALDNIFDAVLVTDTEGLIEGYNRASLRMFGYNSDEFPRQNANLLFEIPFLKLSDEEMSGYLTSGKFRLLDFGYEMNGKRKDGRLFPIEVMVSELWNTGAYDFLRKAMVSDLYSPEFQATPEVRLLSQKEIEALVKGNRGLLFAVHDISERKQAEDILKQSTQ